ncbi:pro-resilin-like [Pectinophora gossypiella]|uniref:pro-resilin-like n=1 Tax=Pectinophora gossypiella TaxID=13191 RepID=UPI00214E792C|nr:pro-resilin-like [Pectinophora gossypiella]
MAHLKVLSLALLATLAACEPPVQGGYNYRRPNYQSGYTAPNNQYLPPSSGYNAPSNSYLPPNSFGHTGPTHSGFGQAQSNYDNSGSGHYDHGQDHGHGHENEVPKSYEFGYSVKDAQSGNDYDRRESSDGNVVRGEYRVQLPDGRTQIVTYHADWQTGFHADVRYEGEAHYPEPTHSNQQGYNYNTPSDFSGSLTGFQSRNTYKKSTAYGPPGYH